MKTRGGRGEREEGRRGEGGEGNERKVGLARGHRSYEREVKDEHAAGGKGVRSAGALLDVETARRKKEKGEERKEGEKEPRPR